MSLNSDEVLSAIADHRMVGFCIECGTEHDCLEPDAREVECEDGCGKKVYGAEEILMMGLL